MRREKVEHPVTTRNICEKSDGGGQGDTILECLLSRHTEVLGHELTPSILSMHSASNMVSVRRPPTLSRDRFLVLNLSWVELAA